MATVDDYILDLQHPNQKKIIKQLHNLLCTFPTLQPRIRFKIPFYFQLSWVCYLNPVKPNKVEFVFLRGQELGSTYADLQARGRKMVKGIMIENLTEDVCDDILVVLQEALELDKRTPYSIKNQRKNS